jgi:hypothetical protein
MIIKNIKNYSEFHAEVFKQAHAIMEDSRCSTFTLIGYKYLDVRLILNFHDCNQVFDFTFNREVMEVESFFTKDLDHDVRMDEMKKFKTEMEYHKPE